MSNYVVLVYKRPSPKWVSVDLITTDLLYVNNFSIKCIIRVNYILAYFYFFIIIRKIKLRRKIYIIDDVTIYFNVVF